MVQALQGSPKPNDNLPTFCAKHVLNVAFVFFIPRSINKKTVRSERSVQGRVRLRVQWIRSKERLRTQLEAQLERETKPLYRAIQHLQKEKARMEMHLDNRLKVIIFTTINTVWVLG